MVSLIGTVTKWFPKRHFGKITSDSEGTFDVHLSAWKDPVEPMLGMAVEFSLVHDFAKSKLVAANVRCLDSIFAPEVSMIPFTPRTPRAGTIFCAPSERKLSEDMVTGTVQIWSRKGGRGGKGYGFISSDTEIQWPSYHPAGCRIYVSGADLLEQSSLRVGKLVQFRIYKCDEGKTEIGAAEVRELPEPKPLIQSNISAVPFWEWPLTQDEKKMRVMSLFQIENSDLQDEFEKCQEQASEKLKQTQKQLKQAQKRIAELESLLLQGSSSRHRR